MHGIEAKRLKVFGISHQLNVRWVQAGAAAALVVIVLGVRYLVTVVR